jgi:hypothetical protein
VQGASPPAFRNRYRGRAPWYPNRQRKRTQNPSSVGSNPTQGTPTPEPPAAPSHRSPLRAAALRLITCDGPNAQTGVYDNTVIFARLVGARHRVGAGG